MSASKAISLRMYKLMRSEIANNPQISTQSKFAIAIGIHYSQFSRWKSGAGSCTVENIADCCRLFGWSPDYIITGKEPSHTYKELEKRIEKIEKILAKKGTNV